MAKYDRGYAFGGNPFIRKANVGWGYTPEQLDELERCARDPIYFIEHYVWIKHVDSEDLVLFKLRGYQLEMVEKMMNNREYICKLPRQAGKTVCVSATLLWHLIFNKNYSILVAAHKGDKARDVLAMIKYMYELLPAFIQQGVLEWNKGNIVLSTGSRVRAASTSGTSARGDTYNLAYVDEAAFIAPHVSEAFFKSVIPTISSGKTTKIFITSTPQGLNHFYKMWRAAVEGNMVEGKLVKSGYAWTEIKWSDVPGRDADFRAKIISEFGQQYWDQEYGAEFLGSSHTLISAGKLLAMYARQPIVETPVLRVYAQPEPGRQYVTCADVSEGVIGDYSVAVVFDVTRLPYRLAAVYRDNGISTLSFPQVLFNLGKSYNMALTMVETTGIGQEVANGLLRDLEYENVALTQPSKRMLGRILSGMFSGSPASRVGLRMDKQSKAIGCGKLKAIVEGDQLIIDDSWAIDELRRFARGKRGSYEAEEGHDDVAMALVQFAWMVDQGYLRESNDLSAASAVRGSSIKSIEQELLPIVSTVQPKIDAPIAGTRDWWAKWAADETADPQPEQEAWERIGRMYPD